MLVLDGAYTLEHDKPHFHRAPAPSPTELRQLLDTLIARITRTLVRGGELIEEPEHPYLDLELNSPLEQLSAAAVRYPFAVGPQAGRKTMTLRNPGAATAWQGLFQTIPCIPAIAHGCAGAAKNMDCAGAAIHGGQMQEVGRSRSQSRMVDEATWS